jgi:hypothetical protein
VTRLTCAPLSELLKRDASLTYRLLRLVNSPVCAMRQEVRSIQAALMAVGDETFRRIATLAIASELNSRPPTEFCAWRLCEARFCELVAEMCALDPTEQYLLGMLSLLPAMLRLPMEELTPDAASARRDSPGAPGYGQLRTMHARMDRVSRARQLGSVRRSSASQRIHTGGSHPLLWRSLGLG